jgi:hypothetical protein
MKRFASIAICTGLLAVTSIASAAGNQLAPVKVQGVNQLTTACTPPDARAVCSAWHATIRANFSPREIGMLFGARSNYPNYAATLDRLQVRYNALQTEFVAAHAAELGTIAAK